MQKISIYQPETRVFSALNSLNLTTWVSECLDHGTRFIFIDLRYVSFLDSRGLGALLIVHNRVERSGGYLGLCGLSGQARMALEVSSMAGVFNVYESYADFKASVESRGSEITIAHEY